MNNETFKLLPRASKIDNTHVRRRLRSRESQGSVERKDDGSYVSRLWHSVTSTFDDQPYTMIESLSKSAWHLCKRVVTLSILVGAIILGAKQKSFDITDRNVWHTFSINEDAQLAIFGLLNTILAILVRDSLSHITDTIITKWMVEDHGASVLDFEMYQESINPWAAISNTHTRRKLHGWRFRDLLRFAICTTTGICLLLQGASMNTIGMPKMRWWPDPRFARSDPADGRFFFDMPAKRVTNVDYMSIWSKSWNIIRDGGLASWEIAHALGAASVFETFGSIHEAIDQPAGWTIVSQQAALIRNAINVTIVPAPSTQSLSIHGASSVDIWDEQRRTSKYEGVRRARGWEARLKLNAVSLDTVCYEVSGHPVGAWNASHHGNDSITIYIGPSFDAAEVFAGALCSITVGQALIDVTQWIVLGNINRDKPDYSIDEYGQNRFPAITSIPGHDYNKEIAKQLSDWFNAIIPNLQTVSSNNAVTNLTALSLQVSNVVAGLHGKTTTDGLEIVLSVIFSNILTTFNWTFEDISGKSVRHGPVRWQMYGSGPRLPWQWITAAVIGVSIMVQLADIFNIIFVRKAKGTWLGLGGMLVAANSAARMPSITDQQGAGFLPEKGKSVKYFIRQKVNDEDHANASLCDRSQLEDGSVLYEKFSRGKYYSR